MTDPKAKLRALGIKPMGGDVFAPLSEIEIATIEASIEARLPPTYRQFLLRFGRSVFSTEINCTASNEPLYFGSFYGCSELLTAIDGLKDTLPETIIPIGDDSGDVVFCLGVSGADVGKVYIHNNGWGWHADAQMRLERGERVPLDIRFQTVEEIAPSFEEFINNMEKADDLNS